jgi:hypothetical protein
MEAEAASSSFHPQLAVAGPLAVAVPAAAVQGVVVPVVAAQEVVAPAAVALVGEAREGEAPLTQTHNTVPRSLTTRMTRTSSTSATFRRCCAFEILCLNRFITDKVS